MNAERLLEPTAGLPGESGTRRLMPDCLRSSKSVLKRHHHLPMHLWRALVSSKPLQKRRGRAISLRPLCETSVPSREVQSFLLSPGDLAKAGPYEYRTQLSGRPARPRCALVPSSDEPRQGDAKLRQLQRRVHRVFSSEN